MIGLSPRGGSGRQPPAADTEPPFLPQVGEDAPRGFVPTLLTELELSEPRQDAEAIVVSNGAFGRARVLLRLHGEPLGLVDVPLVPGRETTEALDAAIDGGLAERISRHLARDGMTADPPYRIGALPAVDRPPCIEARATGLETPSVSVVVPTIDRPDALRRSLSGLRSQDYPAVEILVVDNAPTSSGADAVVAELARDMPRLRRLVEPRRGASRARNLGLRSASGAVVAFLDGDARPDRGWLRALVAALCTPGPNGDLPACATGPILPGSLETAPQQWMDEWGGYSKGFERRFFDLQHRRAVGPMFPFAIAACGSGASMAFWRSELAAIGGFDPALGGGTPARSAEDLAAFLDLIATGRTIVYEPAAIVWHDNPRTEAAFRATLRAYGIGLTAYLFRHLAAHPADLPRLASALPAAAAHLLRPSSNRNRRRSPDFPAGTLRDELGGMVQGPLAYVRGRWIARREDPAAFSPQ